LLGTAYGSLGREQEAAEHLALGQDANLRYLPDALTPRLAAYAVNVKARVSEGGRQLASGQVEQAIQTLEQVLRVEPNNVSALNNLAVAYVQRQRLKEAHQLLLKAEQIDPNKYLTYINLSNWAQRTGDPAQALKFAEHAVELAPQVDITHRTRAVCLLQYGRIDEALASAAQAAALNPRDPRTQSLCADLCLRLGRLADAEAYYRRITELSPDRVAAWIDLARQPAASSAHLASHAVVEVAWALYVLSVQCISRPCLGGTGGLSTSAKLLTSTGGQATSATRCRPYDGVG
jgi:Flp pilus assembly protein TadD